MERTFPFLEHQGPIEADCKNRAQKSLPFFLECFKSPRKTMEHFSALVHPVNESSPVWLTMLQHEGDRIFGMVAHGSPELLEQQIEIHPQEVLDWLFVHNFRLIGAYSFRHKVISTLAYQEQLVSFTQGTPTLTKPTPEDWDYFEKICKYCLPLNEEIRVGPIYEFFDAIGNHEHDNTRKFITDSRLINEPCEIAVMRMYDVYRSTLSPMLYAIECKNETAAIDIIEAGARLDSKNDRNDEALHVAVAEFPTLVKRLVEKGACLSTRNDYGHTPLDEALFGSWHDSVRILIEAGAAIDDYCEIELPDSSYRVAISPVLSSALDLQSARMLAEAGATFNVKDLEGETPLHIAVINGRYDLAEYLVKLGCDPKALSNDGETPLGMAHESINESKGASLFINFCKDFYS